MITPKCNGMDTTEFQYLDSDDIQAAGLKVGREEVWQFNNDRLTEAASFCVGCPMIDSCFESATDADLFWTVRGGRLPTRLAKNHRVSRHTPTSDVKDYLPDTCLKGHSQWFMKDGHRRCFVCVDAKERAGKE